MDELGTEMNNKLIIRGEMTDLNYFINETRKSRYSSADIKKEETERVFFECKAQRIKSFQEKVDVRIHIFAKDYRKDEDNYFIYTKWILDGLVKAGIMQGDSMKYCHVSQLEVFVDINRPRVEVEITPAV